MLVRKQEMGLINDVLSSILCRITLTVYAHRYKMHIVEIHTQLVGISTKQLAMEVFPWPALDIGMGCKLFCT